MARDDSTRHPRFSQPLQAARGFTGPYFSRDAERAHRPPCRRATPLARRPALRPESSAQRL